MMADKVGTTSHLETMSTKVEGAEQSELHTSIEASYDDKFRKRVLRKIDIHLLPMLGALYTIAVVDRSNISVARISGKQFLIRQSSSVIDIK